MKYSTKLARLLAPTKKARRLITHQVKLGRFSASLPRLIRTEAITPSATARSMPAMPTTPTSTSDKEPLSARRSGTSQRTPIPITTITRVNRAVIATRRRIPAQSMGLAVCFNGVSLTIIVRTVATTKTAIIARIAAQRLPAVTSLEMVNATTINGSGSSKKALIPEYLPLCEGGTRSGINPWAAPCPILEKIIENTITTKSAQYPAMPSMLPAIQPTPRKAMISSTVLTRMKGLLLPQREVLWSESMPATACTNSATINETSRMLP